MFSKQTYIDRRQVLQSKFTSGILLFLGNIENPMNFKDNPYPFRQDSSFLYYFGVQAPSLAAIIDVEDGETIIFGDELSIDDIVWMGKQETLAHKCDKAGVTETLASHLLSKYISKAKNSGREIHFLPPYQPVNKIVLSDLLNQPISQLKSSVKLVKAIVSQRSIKEPQEVLEIEKAVNVSNQMHLLAMKMAKPGLKELHLANAVQKWAADQDCRLSYPSIMTIHGEILHNHYQQNTLKIGDMVLNDSGAETAMGYAGDLTRTFPVDKTFSTKQKEVYNIVLDAFEKAQSILKPGLNYKQVHLKAAETLVEGLVSLGLMKGDPKEAVANNAHTLFFQCGVGHMMGLDVHDMEDLGEQYVGYTEQEPKDTKTFGWKSLRLGRPLESGFVVTVEPGIYFIPELIDLWKAENKLSNFINYEKLETYRDFGGIRIEDDFLITNDAYRLLGNGLVKTAEQIEHLRQESL